MLHIFEPTANSREGDRIRRSPAVPVAGSVALGILLDYNVGYPFEYWLSGTGVALLVALIASARRSSLGISIAVLAACGGLGGAWHQWRWDCVARNDISTWATDRGQSVVLTAKVLQSPQNLKLNRADDIPWQVPERTMTVVECQALKGVDGTFVDVTGRARLTIIGQMSELGIGDQIRIIGILSLPSEPANPGEFDSRAWMRSQGLRVRLIAEFPKAVQVMSRDLGWQDRILAFRAAVRKRAENLISDRMEPRTAPVAQSLLLGSRVEIDPDLQRAFAESGTLHVLAISGMNVGLLWMWLWKLFRVFRCSPTISLMAVLSLLPAYAFLTDANPPVVRATIIAVVMALGQLGGRQDSRWNSLSIAALLVLAWNPSDLFNAGAQLSFVAVVVILLITGFLKSVRVAIVQDDGPIRGTVLRRVANLAIPFLIENYVVGVGIWVITSPLIVSQFHLVSPVGILVNIIVGPLIALMFWLGYSFLLLGMAAPTLFGWLGIPFDITVGWFLWSVEFAARWELGHNYVPAPPLWWTIGFYILTLSLVFLDHFQGRIFWSARAALAWSVLGLAVTLNASRIKELSCTVLSVGHGLCILVECPNGRTLLYDAGSMMGTSKTARTIEAALWESGKAEFDAVVVSHADADHCNALPELYQVVPCRALFVHRTFLDWTQPPVAAAIERSAKASVPIRLLAAGQSLAIDPDVRIQVLHPAPDFRGSNDNSNSLVLCLEYRGRRVLLTGDLERDGLNALMQSPSKHVDILLSPHHGSLSANSTDLARWASPEWLIVSCRDDAVCRRLVSRFGNSTQIMSTANFGALRCRIRSDGTVHVDPFRNPP